MATILPQISRAVFPLMDRFYFEAFIAKMGPGFSCPGILTTRDASVVGISLDKELKLYFWVTKLSTGVIQGLPTPEGWAKLDPDFNQANQTFKDDEDLLTYIRGLRYGLQRESEEEYLDPESAG